MISSELAAPTPHRMLHAIYHPRDVSPEHTQVLATHSCLQTHLLGFHLVSRSMLRVSDKRGDASASAGDGARA